MFHTVVDDDSTRSPDPFSDRLLESGYDLERVARRLQVKPERLAAWEEGTLPPTLRQVQELGRFYQRPLGLFFQPTLPRVPPLAAEYRRLPGIVPGEEPPELRLAVRHMSTRREVALGLMEELGEDVAPFSLQARLGEAPESVAAGLRSRMAVLVEAQLAWANEYEAFASWRQAIESLGVLVFQFSKVPLEAARGVTLLSFPLPAIGLNGKEQPEPRAFTLVHELVHLMLAATHEEEPALREKRNAEGWLEVERFAETVAGHTLAPTEALQRVISNELGRTAAWDIANVRRLARRFRITPLAMATRLREAGYMDWQEYRSWREAWDACVASLPVKKPGGPDHPINKAVRRNGRPFTQLVLEALNANRITSVEAARYLDLRFEHFEGLTQKLRRDPRAWHE